MLPAILDRFLFQWISQVDKSNIVATIECNSDRKPVEVRIRIPHPEGKIPTKVTGGVYDKATETVTLKPFSGNADLKIEY